MKRKVPKKCISVGEAKELQQTWCDTRAKDIEKCMKFQDTREFWYSVAELEEYLRYVKRESLKQGIIKPGIRIYFGAYPQEKCKHNHGYSTVFLSPTGAPVRSMGKDADSEPNNYGIDPLNGAGAGFPPKIY